MKTLASLLLASTSLLVGACSDSSSDSDKTEARYADTAQAVGNSTAQHGGEVSAMGNVTAIAKGTMPIGFTLGANGSVNGSSFGLSYTFDLSCKNAGGTTLALCDGTTDSATASADWSGTLDLPGLYASATRSGDWQVTGLQGSQASFSGDGSLQFDSTTTNAAYHFSYDASYDAVLIDTATDKAVGGSLHYAIDATATKGSDTASFSMDADVAFSASDTATLTLDDDHVYTIDLATGATVKVSAN